jgi:endonuclease YncB( thermonuclease family)
MKRLTRYLRWPGFPRRRRVAILWPLLILLAALVGFLQLLTTDGGTAGTATPRPFISPTPLLETPIPTPTPTPPPFNPNWQSLEQATVLEVIDGDTIYVLIDGEPQAVRYYGVDAPEEGEKCYQEATERNRQLLGTTVRLEPDARDKDEYGRLLRYVFTDEGMSIDSTLISEGLAKAWREDGRYLTRLTLLETHARENGIGCLWE